MKQCIPVQTCSAEYSELLGEQAESIFIELELKTSNGLKKFIICSIYRPPHLTVRPFVDSIEALLEFCKSKSFKFFLFCDFNVHFEEYPHGSAASGLFSTFLAYSYFPLVNRPTSISKSSCSIIDNVFTNDFDVLLNSRTDTIVDKTYDHFPIMITTYMQRKIFKSAKPKIKDKLCMNASTIEEF